MKRYLAWVLIPTVAGFIGLESARAEVVEVEASGPQGAGISIYDAGFGLVTELRRLTLAPGENAVRFGRLPRRLDPSTVSVVPLTGGDLVDVLDQKFVYDLASAEQLFARYLGQEVEVHTRDGIQTGRLLAAPDWDGEPGRGRPLVLAAPDGGARMFIRPDSIVKVLFPGASRMAYLEPTLIWRAETEREGPQSLRLSYRSDGFSWQAAYEAIVTPEGDRAHFAGRVVIENRSGGDFEEALIQLISTERGAAEHPRRSAVTAPRDRVERTPLRYAYGEHEPAFEKTVTSLAPVHTYRLARPQTLEHGATRLVQYALAPELPVSRFYVYDGVKFDRFQRYRRNDWNYGTEYHTTVETHLKFENTEHGGLGINLPGGMLRLYQQRDDDSVEFIGEDFLLPTESGEEGHVLLGPARGLRGERERTGYIEVTPLHEYEESFHIRLENNSDETVEIRVVEHLYRWHEFEIVRADTEYEITGPQTIEFRPTLRPGGRRSIHYTVRYSW